MLLHYDTFDIFAINNYNSGLKIFVLQKFVATDQGTRQAASHSCFCLNFCFLNPGGSKVKRLNLDSLVEMKPGGLGVQWRNIRVRYHSIYH